VLVSSLSCTPSSLGPNASSTCIVTLTQPAPGGGAGVTLSNTNPTLTVPASITVPAAAVSASFNATTAAISSNASATITASYGASSAAATVSLVSPVLLTGLTCSPTTLTAAATSTCTLTLNQSAPAGGITISLSNTNASALSTPVSVSVLAAASTAAFAATASNISTAQSATVGATLGSSSFSATISVQAATTTTTQISFVQATANGPSSSAKTFSVPFTSKTNTGDLILVGFDFNSPAKFSSITDSLGNTFTQIGSELTSPGGGHTRLYYAKNIKGGADTVTVNLSAISSFLEVFLSEYAGVDQTNPIDGQSGAFGSAGTVSSGNATSTIAGDMIYGWCFADWACTAGTGFNTRSNLGLSLIEDITAGSAGSYAAIASANEGWTMQMVALKPAAKSSGSTAQVSVAPGKSATSIAASAAAPGTVSAAHPQSGLVALSCSPREIRAGGQAVCELRVAANSTASQIELASSSQQVKVPSTVTTRANQTRLTFQISADLAARQQIATVTATAGGATIQDSIGVAAASHPIVNAPSGQTVTTGRRTKFMVTATDPTDLPLQLSASNLPIGASFDATSGNVDWTPSAAQVGKHTITFTATNATNQSSSAQVAIEITSGAPALATVQQPCSPGAVASLKGSSLSEAGSTLSDPSGRAIEIGGTKVKVNGQYVPVLSVSPTEVHFACPIVSPGTTLEAAVETPSGVSGTLYVPVQGASPRIFVLGGAGQGQGLASFSDMADLAMPRNSQVAAHPAQPGDEILLWGTGFGSTNSANAGRISVKVGGVDAEVEEVRAVPGYAGVYTVQVRVPVPTILGDEVPVQVQVIVPDGSVFNSNTVTVAVEAVNQ
jgi:uncharacterized protein (TIGR03437 family)